MNLRTPCVSKNILLMTAPYRQKKGCMMHDYRGKLFAPPTGHVPSDPVGRFPSIASLVENIPGFSITTGKKIPWHYDSTQCAIESVRSDIFTCKYSLKPKISKRCKEVMRLGQEVRGLSVELIWMKTMRLINIERTVVILRRNYQYMKMSNILLLLFFIRWRRRRWADFPIDWIWGR